MKRESNKAPDIGGLVAIGVMDFCSGPPMQFLSGVDNPPRMGEAMSSIDVTRDKGRVN